MQGIRLKTLYNVLRKTDASSCHHIVKSKINEISSCIFDSTMLWHLCLIHIYQKGLHDMHSKGVVEGFPNCSSEFDFYEHCINGKQNRLSFPTKAPRENRILELVHSDVF